MIDRVKAIANIVALLSFFLRINISRIMANEHEIMELNENASRVLVICLSLASFFIAFSAIGDYSCRRPYPVSPSRFSESITRRSCNIFVTGDIVATDTNKAQTDGRTDRRMDRQGRCCIFRLLSTR